MMIRTLLFSQDTPEAPAVIDASGSVSYLTLQRQAVPVQHLLLHRRDRSAALLLPGGSDYIAAFWGILMAGKTVFPLHPQLTCHEIIPLLRRAEVRTIVTSERFRPLMAALTEAVDPLQIIYLEALPHREEMAVLPVPDREKEIPLVYLTTSGTTGRVKIVPLSDRNILTSVRGYIDRLDYTSFGAGEIRYLLALSFSSAYGIMLLSVCLLMSFPIILSDELITPDTFHRLIEEHRITHCEAGPALLLLLEKTAGRKICRDIRCFTSLGFGGGRVPETVLENLLRTYPGLIIQQGYGMTEAAPLITKQSVTTRKKTGSVGPAIRGVTVKIAQDGRLTDQPGQYGEIAVRGDNVMAGYYRNREATGKILRDGWLYTGDIGYLDEQGCLYICGRSKNIIIVRGFNVYPEEVENVLLGSGLVSDCVVYGEVSPNGNETVCADIIPTDAAADPALIRSYCQAHLAGYKQPQKINFVSTITKTITNKTARKERPSS